jgi:hypothetical protein
MLPTATAAMSSQPQSSIPGYRPGPILRSVIVIPWSSLKHYLTRSEQQEQETLPRKPSLHSNC